MDSIFRTRALVALVLVLAPACSKQQYAFQLVPYTETFKTRERTSISSTVTPKTHILFVEDNSGSMAAYQQQLATGLTNWSNTYLKSQYDISLASITTDTYATSATSGVASCLARMVPGVHDGKIPYIADNIANAFNSDCSLTPTAAAQIVARQDRSLRPILTTIPQDGSTADDAYLAQLLSDFFKNFFPGTNGSGSERGFQSIYQFILANESRPECSTIPASDPSCFFPHYSLATSLVLPLNIVVFLSDEHDHSQSAFGGATSIDHTDGTISRMTDTQLRSSSLTLSTAVKGMLDKFFTGLADGPTADSHYAVMGIVNITCNSSIDTPCGIQANGSRNSDERWGIEYDSLVDGLAGYAGDANRLAQPADTHNQLAKYSQLYDINQTDYSPLFNFIGQQIQGQSKTVSFSQFTLTNTPASALAMKVTLNLSNGTKIPISNDWLSITQDYDLLIADQFLQLIPPDDDNATITVTYSLRCRGHCASPGETAPTTMPTSVPTSGPSPGGNT